MQPHRFSASFSVLGLSYKGYNSRDMADPEPGRCRRTDGKKWRCYKNVVEDQKYCERHMHRGRRQRSRKLVEGLGNEPKSCLVADTSTLQSATTKYQFALAASGTGKSTPSMANICSISRKKVNLNSHHSSFFPTTASIKADSICRNPSDDLGNRSETQILSEPMRCKRTDGKQWRCSHIVVNGAKYCEKHMHRGAKKVTQISNPPVVVAADPSGGSDNPFYIAKREKSFINLNIDPSTAIVACGMTVNDVTQPTRSSSSSNTTTISVD